jgi:hypothetical protein
VSSPRYLPLCLLLANAVLCAACLRGRAPTDDAPAVEERAADDDPDAATGGVDGGDDAAVVDVVDAGRVDEGGATDGGVATDTSGPPDDEPFYVFTIALENKSDVAIYGNPRAPYLNNVLMADGGHALAYRDCFALSVPSEPHYVWLEAGTNRFDDHEFLTNAAPSADNSTGDTRHIAHQLDHLDLDGARRSHRTWRAYQEGLSDATGACPLRSAGAYAPKHNPFVFFRDVAGEPPDVDNAACARHHRALTHAGFAADLAADDVVTYTFLTPDLCNDMHGHPSCQNGCTSVGAPACVSAGDDWLSAYVPLIEEFLTRHRGVLLLVWDEPEVIDTQPFVVLGPGVKRGFANGEPLSHRSYTKSVQKMLGLPVDPRVADAKDFGDFFVDGLLPH